eukprot:12660203-Prorocentrum_lima.AAC.1
MTSSLVGSEMCIRDRTPTELGEGPQDKKRRLMTLVREYLEEIGEIDPVSYTHLTLPTICSV